MSFASTHNSSARMAEALRPTEGYRGQLRKRGIQPRNHELENRAALRELSAKQKWKKLEKKADEEAQPWKLREFREVQSRYMDTKCPSRLESGPSENFLRRGAASRRFEARADAKSSGTPRERNIRKPPVPLKNETMKLAPREKRDFIMRNRTEALELRPPVEAPEEDGIHESFGAVPSYLRERKKRWAEAEEARLASLPDPSCPPGTRLMPEDERVETLRDLEESEKELQQMLFRIPLSATAMSLLRRREDLEQKLKKIEDAKIIFSRERVYVAEE